MTQSLISLAVGTLMLVLAAAQFYIAVRTWPRSTREPTAVELLLQQATNEMIQLAAQTDSFGTFVIHTPAAGCPQGWTVVPALFTESDGTTRSGCVLEKGDLSMQHLDYLDAGESLPVVVPVIPERNTNGRAL